MINFQMKREGEKNIFKKKMYLLRSIWIIGDEHHFVDTKKINN